MVRKWGRNLSNLLEAKSVAEFIELLKAEQGDSYASLGDKVGVDGSTLHRLVNSSRKADDDTLDKLAEYANVPRQWLYRIAGKPVERPRYSAITMTIANIIERLEPEDQESVLAMVDTLARSRKKQRTNMDQKSDDIVSTE